VVEGRKSKFVMVRQIRQDTKGKKLRKEMKNKENAKLQKILTAYLKEIHGIYTRKDFSEGSFYSSLEDLFKNCSQFFLTNEEAKALVLPKKTEVGIPDISIRKNAERIGDIEAKVPDSNLNEVEKTEQIQRYLSALPNLILTNFVEFRRYRNGEFVEKVELCPPVALQGLKPPVPMNMDAFFDFIGHFYDFAIPEIRSASQLAIILADKTKFSRQILKEVLEREDKESIPLESFYAVFKKTLIGGLTEERFVE